MIYIYDCQICCHNLEISKNPFQLGKSSRVCFMAKKVRKGVQSWARSVF